MKNPFADKIKIDLPRLTIETLRRARPDLFAWSPTYAIECALAEVSGLPHPRTPIERKRLAGVERGKEITRAAARKRLRGIMSS